jgi:hypothetical protein
MADEDTIREDRESGGWLLRFFKRRYDFLFPEGIARIVCIWTALGVLVGFLPVFLLFLCVSIRFSWWVHFPMAFFLGWMTGVVGAAAGFLIGFWKIRLDFGKASLRQKAHILGVGAVPVLCLAIAFSGVIPRIRATKEFVEQLRVLSTWQAESITVVGEVHPEPDVQVTITEPALVGTFLEKLSQAEPYTPSHDSPRVRGDLTLNFKDKKAFHFKWYYGTNNYKEGAVVEVPAAYAGVPGLDKLLCEFLEAGTVDSAKQQRKDNQAMSGPGS